MKLKRFEFGDTGFFNALELIDSVPDLSEDDEIYLGWAEGDFASNLEIPNIFAREDAPKNIYCFFKPKGLERFNDSIDIFWNLFYQLEDAGLGEIVEIELDSSSVEVVWEDEYQAVVKMSFQEIDALRDKVKARGREYSDVAS